MCVVDLLFLLNFIVSKDTFMKSLSHLDYATTACMVLDHFTVLDDSELQYAVLVSGLLVSCKVQGLLLKLFTLI